MTGRRVSLSRRDLARVLMGAGAGAAGYGLLAGCSRGPTRVPTSSEVPKDPLAALDPKTWNASSAADLLALPLAPEASEVETWKVEDLDPEAVEATRKSLVDLLEVAYLDPERLGSIPDADARAELEKVIPEFWQDDMATAWDMGDRHFYAVGLAAPHRVVGKPRIAADWYRVTVGTTPGLAFGGTVAWTVIEPSTRAVGVIAHRIGLRAVLASTATPTGGRFWVTVHGIDVCTTDKKDGLVVPAIADEDAHRSAQEATMQKVIGSPRIPRDVLEESEPTLFSGDETTNVLCA